MKNSSDTRAKAREPRSFLLLFAFNVIVIALMLTALELYLRHNDPRPLLPLNTFITDKDNPDNFTYYTWGNLVKLNGEEFREREFPKTKGPDVYRIMILGDSFTFGNGLAVEQRYSNLLQARLNKDLVRAGLRFEVLNFGIEGVPTVSEKNVLRFYKDKIKPDLIVVGFCLNDPQIKGQGSSVERDAFNKRWGPYLGFMQSRLSAIGLRLTAETVEKAVYRLAEKTGRIPTWQTALDRTYDRSSAQWQKFTSALYAIKADSDSLGIAPPIFAVLNQATYTDRPTDYKNPDAEARRFLRWYAQAEEAAHKAGFTAYDHTQEVIDKLSSESLAINIMDPHPSPALNKVYADKLFDVISSRYLKKRYD